jgi:hypothetical protein
MLEHDDREALRSTLWPYQIRLYTDSKEWHTETSMGRFIGISGSLRRASFNSMLLRAASQLAPHGTTIEIASIRGIPLYDGDVESAEGIPAPVAPTG